MNIQSGFSKFSGFYTRVVSISIYFKYNFSFASICTIEYPRTGKSMNFTPEVEDEVIMYAVSHKLDRPLVNPSN